MSQITTKFWWRSNLDHLMIAPNVFGPIMLLWAGLCRRVLHGMGRHWEQHDGTTTTSQTINLRSSRGMMIKTIALASHCRYHTGKLNVPHSWWEDELKSPAPVLEKVSIKVQNQKFGYSIVKLLDPR